MRTPARSRRYRDDTLILETRFETDAGAVLIIDFMPPRGEASDLIRLVIGERGEVAMHTELVLRFGYGAAVPWVTRIGEQTWRAIAGPDMTILRTPAPLHGENLKTVADFVVRRGESRSVRLVVSAVASAGAARRWTSMPRSARPRRTGATGSRRAARSVAGRRWSHARSSRCAR